MALQPPRAVINMDDDSAEYYLRMVDDFDEYEETSTVLKDKLLPARVRSYWDW